MNNKFVFIDDFSLLTPISKKLVEEKFIEMFGQESDDVKKNEFAAKYQIKNLENKKFNFNAIMKNNDLIGFVSFSVEKDYGVLYGIWNKNDKDFYKKFGLLPAEHLFNNLAVKGIKHFYTDALTSTSKLFVKRLEKNRLIKLSYNPNPILINNKLAVGLHNLISFTENGVNRINKTHKKI